MVNRALEASSHVTYNLGNVRTKDQQEPMAGRIHFVKTNEGSTLAISDMIERVENLYFDYFAFIFFCSKEDINEARKQCGQMLGIAHHARTRFCENNGNIEMMVRQRTMQRGLFILERKQVQIGTQLD